MATAAPVLRDPPPVSMREYYDEYQRYRAGEITYPELNANVGLDVGLETGLESHTLWKGKDVVATPIMPKKES